MNIGKKVLTSITLKTGLVLVMVAAVALAVIPQVKDTAIGADPESCEVVTNTPALNAFPVTTSFPRESCHDRPFLWAGLNGNYSYTHSAQVGDVIEIRSYVHNSAPDGGPAAYNVRVNFNIDTQQGTSHIVSASATSDNAGGKNGSITINTPANAALEVVPNSGQILDYYGNSDSSGTGSVQLGASGASAHFGSMLACFKYSKFIVFKVKVVGAVTPPPAEQKFDFSAAPNPVCVGDRSTYTVSNASAGLNGKMIFWSSTKNGQATGENMSGYNQFVSNGYWSDQGNTWTSADIGNWTKTATIDNISRTVSFTVKDCAVTPPPAEQKFNLSVTPNPVCVGSRSTYTVSNATEGLRNKMIFWSSTKNGQATGENLSGYNQYINASGFFTDQGNTWTSADIGTWTKTATVYGPNNIPVSKSVTFEVKSCEEPQQLVCTPASQTVSVNQPASFTAAGGTGPYSWSAPGGSATSGTGSYFTTSYAVSGNRIVTVTSGSQVAHCSVLVKQQVVDQAVIQLVKNVRNVTSGGSFAHSASAKTGDTVEYRIEVSSANNIPLTNVRVTDTFTPGLNYVNQTLTVNGQNHAPGLTSGGLTFNTLDGGKLTIIYRATVVAASGSIINTAQARADNASNVATDQALVDVVYVEPGQPSLTISKQVKNVTKGGGYSTTATAAKNDVLSYQIVVTNAGNAAANEVYVSDYGTSGLSGLSGLSVSKSHTGNLPGNISLGTLAVGESVTITYQATVNIENGQLVNTATVSASNAASRSSYAVVSVSTTSQPPATPGNYYYNSNNNFCVNNSCNITYINNYGNQVPANEYRQLSVRKQVRNLNSGTFGDSVTANNNDIVEFEIVVTNSGNQVVNNVRMTDTWTSGLSYVQGSTRIDGSGTGDGWYNNTLSLGSLFTGQQKRIVFQARVNSYASSSIQNTASASGDNASSVQDDAWVFIGSVAGGDVNLQYSKRAQNDTKGADAMSVIASREDYITYTLTVANTGNTPATNFIITDDLSQVLPYADMVDNGGGTVSGNVITFPGLTIPAGGSVSKSFRVRVKYFLADNLSYVMTNTYGNTVTVRINTPQIKGAFIAPRTGADSAAFLFAGLLTSGAALIKKRKDILKLIFT